MCIPIHQGVRPRGVAAGGWGAIPRRQGKPDLTPRAGLLASRTGQARKAFRWSPPDGSVSQRLCPEGHVRKPAGRHYDRPGAQLGWLDTTGTPRSNTRVRCPGPSWPKATPRGADAGPGSSAHRGIQSRNRPRRGRRQAIFLPDHQVRLAAPSAPFGATQTATPSGHRAARPLTRALAPPPIASHLPRPASAGRGPG